MTAHLSVFHGSGTCVFMNRSVNNFYIMVLHIPGAAFSETASKSADERWPTCGTETSAESKACKPCPACTLPRVVSREVSSGTCDSRDPFRGITFTLRVLICEFAGYEELLIQTKVSLAPSVRHITYISLPGPFRVTKDTSLPPSR